MRARSNNRFYPHRTGCIVDALEMMGYGHTRSRCRVFRCPQRLISHSPWNWAFEGGLPGLLAGLGLFFWKQWSGWPAWSQLAQAPAGLALPAIGALAAPKIVRPRGAGPSPTTKSFFRPEVQHTTTEKPLGSAGHPGPSLPPVRMPQPLESGSDPQGPLLAGFGCRHTHAPADWHALRGEWTPVFTRGQGQRSGVSHLGERGRERFALALNNQPLPRPRRAGRQPEISRGRAFGASGIEQRHRHSKNKGRALAAAALAMPLAPRFCPRDERNGPSRGGPWRRPPGQQRRHRGDSGGTGSIALGPGFGRPGHRLRRAGAGCLDRSGRLRHRARTP